MQIFHPPALFPLLAATLLFAPALASADDDAARRAAAEEFLKARGTEAMVNGAAEQMASNTDRISEQAAHQAGTAVNLGEFTGKLKAEARTMIHRELNWENLKGSFVDAYAQAFTEAELKEMIAFYKSPTGQKLVAKDPEVLGKLEKVSREKTMGIMPKVVQRLREMVVEVNPEAAKSGPGMAPPLPPGLKIPPSPPPGLVPPAMPPGMPPGAPQVSTPAPTATPAASAAH